MGLFPLYTDCFILSQMEESTVHLVDNGKHCWMNWVKIILEKWGMEMHSENQNCLNLITLGKTQLKEKYETFWKSNMWDDNKNQGGKNKLRTYREFKEKGMYENYLNDPKITNFTHRHQFTRYNRISAYDLNIERERYNNTPVEERICKCDVCHWTNIPPIHLYIYIAISNSDDLDSTECIDEIKGASDTTIKLLRKDLHDYCNVR